MQIGSVVPVSDEIRGLGFAFVESVKILGMEITCDPADWDKNFVTIFSNMRLKKKLNFGTALTCHSQAEYVLQKAFWCPLYPI